MSSPERTFSSIECSDALQDQSSLRATPPERFPKRCLSLSSFEKADKTQHDEDAHFQHGRNYRKSQTHEHMRSVENHPMASFPQPIVLPSPVGPQPPLLSSLVDESSLPSPTTHDARPQKRGVAQKISAKSKRKQVSTKAENEFVVNDGPDDEAPLPKRNKVVATTQSSATSSTPTEEPTTGKRKKTAKARVKPKPKMETHAGSRTIRWQSNASADQPSVTVQSITASNKHAVAEAAPYPSRRMPRCHIRAAIMATSMALAVLESIIVVELDSSSSEK